MHKKLIAAIFAVGTIPTSMPAANAQQANDLQQLLSGKTYGNITAPEDYSYADGNISLKKGQPIAEGIPLSASKLKDFSPVTALQAAGVNLDLSKVQLGEMKFLAKVSVKDLVNVDSTLKNITAESIGWLEQGGKTLSEIATSALGKSPLPESVLKSNSIASFGNIANIPYGNFPGVDKLPITSFLGLGEIPIAKTIPANIPAANMSSGIHMVQIDKVRTQEQGAGVNPWIVTGSDPRRKAPWTSAQPVNVVEIRDSLITNKSNLVNGALMVDGSSQMIAGGNVPSPFQPTALAIPGTNFAVSIHDINAKKGSARVQLNMRLEYPFMRYTSYFIPIPVTFTVTEQSKTTFPFPVEIPQPSPAVATNIPSVVSKSSEPEAQAQSVAAKADVVSPLKSVVPAPASDPVAISTTNGNIGIAVKTNAINPSTEIGG
jgi:hypothetical protein